MIQEAPAVGSRACDILVVSGFTAAGGDVVQFVAGIGSRVRGPLVAAGEIGTLGYLALRSLPDLVGPPFRVVGRVVARQVFFTGNQALILTGLIAFLLGEIVVIQSITRLPVLGAAGFVGDLLVIAVMRELGPLITAVIVIGRSGTAMATELATMRLRGEVDDLDTMGIDPVLYLFLPRLAGAVISIFALIVYFDLIAVVGGYAALTLHTMTPMGTYLRTVFDALAPRDIALVPAKALAFGSLFALVSCHMGLSVGASPTEIPRAATRAVVASLLGIFLVDSVIAFAVYG